MERLELTMTVELPMSYGHCNLDRAIMHAAKEYCDELWIDNQLIPWSNADVLQPETPIHFIKYIFKPGVDYIPEGAFSSAPSSMRIKSITIPEGIKKLKNSCFYNCHFTGDLILPDSLERVCADALHCKIDGVFHLPATVKYISSLPEAEETKDEIILPEGMVSFTPARISTRHLHIPSTLKKCEARYGGRNDKILRITIAPDNPFFILRGDTLINLQDEKREIIKKLKDISRDAMLEKVFGDAGLSFRRYEKDLTFPFQGNGYLSVHYTGDMTLQKANQVADIASRFKRLIDSSDLVRRRQNPPAIGNLNFHDTKISLTLHLESDDSVSLYKGTGKLFSQMVTQMSRLKREYGNKLLEYRISC